MNIETNITNVDTNTMFNRNRQTRIVKYIPFNLREDYEIDNVKDFATLTWTIRLGYPRITVFTSNLRQDMTRSTDTDYSKMIVAPFDIITFKTFIKLFKNIINDGKPGVYNRIDCVNIKYIAGVKTQELYVQGSVLFGLSKESIPVLSVAEEGKLKIAFKIKPSGKWHIYYDKNGNLATDQFNIIKTYALVYLELLDELITTDIIVDVREIKTIKEKVDLSLPIASKVDLVMDDIVNPSSPIIKNIIDDATKTELYTEPVKKDDIIENTEEEIFLDE